MLRYITTIPFVLNQMFKHEPLTYITATPFDSLSTLILTVAVLEAQRTVLTRDVKFDTWFSLNIDHSYCSSIH